MRELLGKGACCGVIRGKRRGLGERIKVCQGGWVMGDILHIWGFHTGNLQRVSRRKCSVMGRWRTISMKRAPTLSSPTPCGRTLPSAISRRATKLSENSASSGRLLKITRVSSRVIGGPSKVVDEPEAVETVRRDDEDD
jgi:hypothetical protein